MGPLVIDVQGTALERHDLQRLQSPLVGGVILFARNFQSPEQLTQLTGAIKRERPDIVIGIDHEGGRVQRCREGFTHLPPMHSLGHLWDESRDCALSAAKSLGVVLATELRECGVDLSFTPVLDLDYGRSTVIGNRAFHSCREAVIDLAGALIEGLAYAGMASCGKHFPGHGWVEADSHLAIPVDERPLEALLYDLEPFKVLNLSAVMPAHVIYPVVDNQPAGFSPRWLTILRETCRFSGVIFSDDLSMEGASVVGGVLNRVEAAWSAGCDMLLVCNAPESVDMVLSSWAPSTRCSDQGSDTFRRKRLEGLLPCSPVPSRNCSLYQNGVTAAQELWSRGSGE